MSYSSKKTLLFCSFITILFLTTFVVEKFWNFGFLYQIDINFEIDFFSIYHDLFFFLLALVEIACLLSFWFFYWKRYWQNKNINQQYFALNRLKKEALIGCLLVVGAIIIGFIIPSLELRVYIELFVPLCICILLPILINLYVVEYLFFKHH